MVEAGLDEIGDVHWHLLDLSGIELFDVTHHSDVFSRDKVDRNTDVSEIVRQEHTPYDRNDHHDRFGGCSFRGLREDRS
jgi:hypothetical protein